MTSIGTSQPASERIAAPLPAPLMEGWTDALSAARRKFLLDRGRVHNRGGESRCDGVGGRDHAQRRGARRARAPGGEADASLSGCAAREGRALRGRWPVERGDRHPAWDVLEGRRAVAATILRTAPGRS